MSTAEYSFSGLLALCRVSNLPTVWMNVLAALVLASAPLSLGAFALLAVSLSAFYCAGMCLNDLYDLEYDTEHQPFRPISVPNIVRKCLQPTFRDHFFQEILGHLVHLSERLLRNLPDLNEWFTRVLDRYLQVYGTGFVEVRPRDVVRKAEESTTRRCSVWASLLD